MDLDERLREILEAESASEKYEKEIAQIKQVTGSYFYERFNKELNILRSGTLEDPLPMKLSVHVNRLILKAAKRASGIDKEGVEG